MAADVYEQGMGSVGQKVGGTTKKKACASVEVEGKGREAVGVAGDVAQSNGGLLMGLCDALRQSGSAARLHS